MGKGSEKNLKKPRSTEEAREWGRKGGIASGKARRKKREMREAIKVFLDMAAKGALETNLEQFGVPKQEQTNQMALVARAFTLAMNGDIRAMEFLRDSMGFGGAESNDNSVDDESGNVTEAKIYLPDNGRD